MIASRFLLLLFGLIAIWSCSRPESPADLSEAETAFSRGSYLESEKLFVDYLQTSPAGEHRWEAWNRVLTISRFIRRDPLRSVELLEAMLLEFSEDRDKVRSLLFELAGELSKNRQYERAISIYDRILQREDCTSEEELSARKESFRLHKRLGNYEGAGLSLSPVLELEIPPEERARVLYELANLAVYRQEDQEAEKALASIVEMEAELGEPEIIALAKFSLADLYERSGRTEEARTLFSAILDFHPNPASVKSRLHHLERQAKGLTPKE